MSFRLHDRGRVVGNREVSHAIGCAAAADEKGARGGNRVSPAGARRSRATGVETDA